MLKRFKTKKFWLTLARDGLLLIILLYLFSLYQTRNTAATTPLLQTQLITGEQVDLKIMAKKSPVLIYFWGSWCPICSFTSSTVTELSKDYQVISIALSSGDTQQVQNYLLENNYHFPVINDPDGLISHTWGVAATPTFFIINSKGEISFVSSGISSAWGLKFRLWLAS